MSSIVALIWEAESIEHNEDYSLEDRLLDVITLPKFGDTIYDAQNERVGTVFEVVSSKIVPWPLIRLTTDGDQVLTANSTAYEIDFDATGEKPALILLDD